MSKCLLKGDVRYLVATLALLGIITIYLILAPARDTFLPPRTKYGLVFDAGSTHTALYIYQWPADKENGTGIISQVEACTVPGAGISSYADNPALAGASLKPCLDKAMMIVPAKVQRETPTYLGATAGMRLLRYLGRAWPCEPGHLCRPFPTTRFWRQTRPPPPPDPPKIGVEDSSSPQQISHPCYPKGYQENITVAALYDSPCVPTPSTPGTAQALMVSGTGDPVACRTAIQKLFNFSCGAHRTCGFNGIYQPPVRGQFFAFSGLYYNLHFLNLTSGQSLSSVNATIWDFCTRDWEKVQKEFPNVDKAYLYNYCAASSYVLTLLLQGYKFNDKTWPNIHFIQKVANIDVGWTLGYMLNLTNMIPSETPQRGTALQRSMWTAATITLFIMLFLCFWLFVAICHQRKLASYETL
nr:PREDICTED: ectonucleoside triphosphate diphosphohydrolase 8-like [Struthio camelus australis]